MSLLLQIAFAQFGTKEIPGNEHNPEVLKYFTAADGPGSPSDETAWCSAFVNWCAMVSGLERTKKLNARSWLNIGDVVNKPIPGDIVIFWRVDPNGWQGHVGIYIGETTNEIFVLGGNQNNQVNVSKYSKGMLLGFRRLNKIH